MTRAGAVLLAALLATAGIASGCSDEGFACTANFVYGLSIEVLDGATGSRICDATLVATEGTYTERLEAFGGANCAYRGAGERRGTYGVAATRSGYREVRLSEIRVRGDRCHVQTESRTITLVRE